MDIHRADRRLQSREGSAVRQPHQPEGGATISSQMNPARSTIRTEPSGDRARALPASALMTRIAALQRRFKPMRALLVALAAFAASEAAAQDSGWSYTSTFYLWLSDTSLTANTPQGPVEAEISVKDALETAKFSFMGALEARRDRWGIIADVIYAVSEDAAADSASGIEDADLEARTAVSSLYVTYRVLERQRSSLDLAVGVRAFRLEADVEVTPTDGAAQSFDPEESWVDPLVGARFSTDLTDRWRGALLVDVGGFGGDSDLAWQALATASYRVSDQWSLSAGYRYLESNRGGRESVGDIRLSGPILGVSYRF